MKKAGVVLSVVCGALWMAGVAHADGAATYAKCKGCHGADGKGNPAIKAPAFDASKSDADLAKVIKEGKGKMPSFNGKLSDAEISEVVKYIKTLK